MRFVKDGCENLQRIYNFSNCGRRASDAKTRVILISTCQSLTNKRKEVLFSVRKDLQGGKGSTLRLHRTGGTGRIFERLSVQVWDLKKAGQLFDRHGSDFVRTRVNTRTMQLFARIARLRSGI